MALMNTKEEIMNSLNIKIYNTNLVSIKDLSKDVDISDFKWNIFFEKFVTLYDAFYFLGSRAWLKPDGFDVTLQHLSESVFLDEGKDHDRVFFQLKSSSLMYNRRMLSKVWLYYEYPSVIFLGDREDEQYLIDMIRSNNLGLSDIIVSNIPNTTIMYRSFEQDVLWMIANLNLKELFGDAFDLPFVLC
jgi:hypothetical protein